MTVMDHKIVFRAYIQVVNYFTGHCPMPLIAPFARALAVVNRGTPFVDFYKFAA
jgi:hypothetical protein